MQCGVEKRTIRSVGVVEVECCKCREKGHKCRKCPLWVKKKRTAHVARSQKVQQEERLACSVKGEAQERRLRRAEEEEAAYVARL